MAVGRHIGFRKCDFGRYQHFANNLLDMPVKFGDNRSSGSQVIEAFTKFKMAAGRHFGFQKCNFRYQQRFASNFLDMPVKFSENRSSGSRVIEECTKFKMAVGRHLEFLKIKKLVITILLIFIPAMFS